MNLLKIIKSTLLIAAIIGSTGAFAEKVVVKSYEELFSQLSNWGFNGAIAITQNGEDIFKQASGYRNADTRTLLEPDDKFPIGSVTKTFTSIGILILQERGKLSLDDNLKKYFPNLKWAAKVTIRQLLAHTSGIYNYTDTPSFFEWSEQHPSASIEDLISFFASKDLEFQPGSKHSYSNSGYVLLGRIIEIESGLIYGEFLEEEIFSPLKMTNSLYDPEYKSGNGPAPHTFDDGISPQIAKEYTLAWAYAAGGIVSTVHDLGKFNNALDNKTLITAESIHEMETVVLDNYALGVMLSKYEGKRIVWHTGGLPYYLAYNIRIPEENLSISVLTNVFDLKLRNILAHAAMDISVTGEASLEYAKPIILPPEQVEDFVGTFFCEEINMGAVVVIEDGKLFVTPSGQPKLRLLPTSPINFEIRGIAEIQFHEDGDSFVLSQNGRKFTFLRRK